MRDRPSQTRAKAVTGCREFRRNVISFSFSKKSVNANKTKKIGKFLIKISFIFVGIIWFCARFRQFSAFFVCFLKIFKIRLNGTSVEQLPARTRPCHSRSLYDSVNTFSRSALFHTRSPPEAFFATTALKQQDHKETDGLDTVYSRDPDRQ